MPRTRKPYWAAHRSRRPHGPAARRGAAAFLAASALAGATVFAISPLPSELGLVALTCDQPKAMRQLAAARETRSDTRALLSELRVSGSGDSRAEELSRQIAGLGFIPAQHTGWRQKAVDVSDQLHGTTDPKMRAVALTLARHGLGPTPADLLDDPPPLPGPGGGLGQALGQGSGAALGGAVNSAAEAADGLAQPPEAAPGDKKAEEPQRTKRQTEPPLPKTCAGSGAEPTDPEQDVASAAPGPDKAAGASGAPRSAGQPPAPEVSSTSSPAPADPPADQSPDGQSEAASPASSSTSAPQVPETGGGTSDAPDQAAHPDQAREAIQLVGELLQALGANGDQDSTRLRDLIQQAMQSGQPQLQPSANQPAAGSGSTGSGSTGSGSTGSGSTGSGSTGEGDAGAWGPSANKLAEQVSQAADSDPLAEQLAEKLRAAGVEVPEASTGGSGTDQPDQGGGSGGSGSTGAGSGASGGEQDGSSEQDGGSGSGSSGDGGGQQGSGGSSGSGSGQDQSAQDAGQGGSGSENGSGSGGGDQNGSSQQDGGSGSGSSNQDSGQQGSGGSGGDQSKQDGAQSGSGSGSGSSGSGSGSSGSGSGSGSGEQKDGAGEKPGQQGAGAAGGEGAGQEPKDPSGGDGGGVDGARADAATWDRLADCESSGDWSADTGNGYHGGLQFDPTTWEAFGGQGSPSSAPREQQIEVAKKVQSEQGWQAWPSCSKKLGLGQG